MSDVIEREEVQVLPLERVKCCSRCGNEYPATSEYFAIDKRKEIGIASSCRTCNRERNRKYMRQRRADPEFRDRQHMEYREWREKNVTHNRERQRKWRENNPNYHSEYNRARRQDPEYVKRERQYEAQPEIRERKIMLSRQYRKNNPEKGRESRQKRRARELQVPSTLTDADWQVCLRHFNHSCAYCGRVADFWHKLAQDHYYPLIRGGGYVPANIVPACHSVKGGDGGCNQSKSSKDPHQWLVEKFGQRRAKRIETRIARYFESLASIENTTMKEE